ncbi:hypothetical protein GCM10017788_11710 [Amycolatopsis acidiphila]|nr:hypothetical protein GCM10017788_11710 [Amycolatopsis acidiphila]
MDSKVMLTNCLSDVARRKEAQLPCFEQGAVLSWAFTGTDPAHSVRRWWVDTASRVS